MKYRRTILMHYSCKKTCICLEAIRDDKYFEIFSSGSFAVDFCEFGLLKKAQISPSTIKKDNQRIFDPTNSALILENKPPRSVADPEIVLTNLQLISRNLETLVYCVLKIQD